MRGSYALTQRALKSYGAVGLSGNFWNAGVGVEFLKIPRKRGPHLSLPCHSPNDAALARFGVPVTDTRPTLSLVDSRRLSSHALLGGEQNEGGD
jgi:hypothetical protein